MSGLTAKRGAILGIILFAGFLTQTVGLQLYDSLQVCIHYRSARCFHTDLSVDPRGQAPQNRKHHRSDFGVGRALSANRPSGSRIYFGDALTFGAAMLYALYLVYLDIITRRTFFCTADIPADRSHSVTGQ